MTGRGLYSEQRLRYNFIIWLKRSIKMSDYITTYTGNHIDPADQKIRIYNTVIQRSGISPMRCR